MVPSKNPLSTDGVVTLKCEDGGKLTFSGICAPVQCPTQDALKVGAGLQWLGWCPGNLIHDTKDPDAKFSYTECRAECKPGYKAVKSKQRWMRASLKGLLLRLTYGVVVRVGSDLGCFLVLLSRLFFLDARLFGNIWLSAFSMRGYVTSYHGCYEIFGHNNSDNHERQKILIIMISQL